jgi:hypothetical protein
MQLSLVSWPPCHSTLPRQLIFSMQSCADFANTLFRDRHVNEEVNMQSVSPYSLVAPLLIKSSFDVILQLSLMRLKAWYRFPDRRFLGGINAEEPM